MSLKDDNEKNHLVTDEADVISNTGGSTDYSEEVSKGMSELEVDDEALRKKIELINNTIDEIGFTPYHLKLFFLSGMGYATDSQLTTIESGVRTFINYQWNQRYPVSAECFQLGLLVGVIFWGFGADLIGRKTAFNSSLFLSAIFCILVGTMGNLGSYCIFVLLTSAACGGNLVLDTCVFLEYLPFKHQWLLTFFAFFWGVGETIAALIIWWGLSNHSCEGPVGNCESGDNQGWRYIYYINGCIVLVFAVLRVTVVQLHETPKFLVSNNRDAEAFVILQNIATKYNRSFSLTLEKLEACGEVKTNNDYRNQMNLKGTSTLVKKHMSTLFSTRKNARLAILLFTSWFFLGIAYPLYTAFLPQYLALRGTNVSASTTSGVYRDNVITYALSMIGPFIAGGILYFFPVIGRRGVMVIGGLFTMAVLFGYTQVKTHLANVALSSTSLIGIYIYYSCLYAYLPEVMPSSARATGNAMCLGCTRFAALITPIIAYYSKVTSSVPIWICGAFVGIIGLEAMLFPYEPSKQRPV